MVAASSLASDATGKGSSVKAELHFLQRSKEYDEIKPYSMRYAPQNEILQTIIKHETKMREIQDMRIFREKLRFQSCGFGVMPFASQMKYADFESLDTIHSVYLGELQAKLKDTFQASYVHVIDTVVRRRHPDFPVSTGKEYEHFQPTALAHIDHSYEGALDMIRSIFGDASETLLKLDWQLINIWRPLKGPLNDWPLAVCDASSVDFDEDTIVGDIVLPDHVIENVHIHSNDAQKWYFLSEQMPSEALVFRDVDSDQNYGAPHAAFPLPEEFSIGEARESIDCRAFVFGTNSTPSFDHD